jgi:hypothetical protein
MKITTAFFLFFFGLTNFPLAQWISNFGGISKGDINFENAKGNAITSDHLGNCYITGYSFEQSCGNDIVTIKYNSTGTMEWAAGYNGTANSDDAGNGICVDQYGNVYVVGSSYNNSRNSDLTLIKYDPNGILVWDKIYGVTNGDYEDKGIAIAVDANSNVYVTGYTTDTDGYTDIVTQKYDVDGNVAWTQLEDGDDGLDGKGLSIKAGASGNVFVCGYTTSDNNGNDIIAVKYDNYGSILWIKTINGNGNSEDKALGIITDSEDNAYITGYVTDENEGYNAFTAKLDQDGNIVWQDSYDGGENQTDRAQGIIVDNDGSVFITGDAYTSNQNTDYLTIKYDIFGNREWIQTYNGIGNGVDEASSICIVMESSGLKKVVVTGKSWGAADNYDYATVRYNTAGGEQTQVNLYSLNSQTNDIANDITASGSNVIITGFSQFIVDGPNAPSVISTLAIGEGQRSELVKGSNLPAAFRLHQNYPNPFNPGTTITFDLPQSGKVTLTIYDIIGRQIAVLINNSLSAGTHRIFYSNSHMASGIYFYELRSGLQRDIKKMNLIK